MQISQRSLSECSLDIIKDEDIDKKTKSEINEEIQVFFNKCLHSAYLTTQTSKIIKNVTEEDTTAKETPEQMQVEETQEDMNIERYDTYRTQLKEHVKLRNRFKHAVREVIFINEPVRHVAEKYKLDFPTLQLKIDVFEDKIKYRIRKMEYELAVISVVSGKESINKVMKRYRVKKKILKKEIACHKRFGENYQFDRKVMSKHQVRFTFQEENRFLNELKEWAKNRFTRNSYSSIIRILEHLSNIAYEYAKKNKMKYPKSWDQEKRADISWIREFEFRNNVEIFRILSYSVLYRKVTKNYLKKLFLNF
ncbi:uncharacterized protein [Anoplolepis gracilipes]|uniref:uncharacterized protein n=1 Tax=Anoplolepis gracilipes TaxID=354296 RepID=UPI003BA16977